MAACSASAGGPVVERTELRAVTVGLLEVIAENLVELDQRLAVDGEPVGESFVQLGPGRFRQRLVGGVADEQVAKAVGVVLRQQRLLGSNQVLPHQRHELTVDRAAIRESRDRSAVEDLALDRAPLQHVALR